MSQALSRLSTETAAPMAEPVLALPDCWVIDPLARERLAWQLSRADTDCPGVVAPLTELLPGASYRTSAERAALTPLTSIAPTDDGAVRGAVLLRPGVDFDVRGGVVEVAGTGLVQDPGAAVHDPSRGIGALSPASTEGRPPFPHRPVVVFLGLDADPDLADQVRVLVNGLVTKGTEGRIAVPEPTDGVHLTRPCAPTQESIAALAPDALVALDDTAFAAGSHWLGDDRSAVVVEMTQDTSDAVELVSWRIGHARGRLRARVGRGVGADALEDLVRRLCAGPQPLPPKDRNSGALTVGRPQKTHSWRRGALDPAPQVLALLGAEARPERARFDGLADHLDTVGGKLAVRHIDGNVPDGALSASVVILRSAPATDDVQELVHTRRRADRPTVIDLAPSDVRHAGDPTTTALPLEDGAALLVDLAGCATTTSRRLRDRLRAHDIRAFVLPTLRPRRRVAALQERRARRKGDGPPLLGWDTGSAAPDADPALLAVARAVQELLVAYPDLRVELVGQNAGITERLGHPERVVATGGDPSAGTIATWTVHCRTISATEVELSGDLTRAIDAGLLGVPTITAADDPIVSDGLVPAPLVVSDVAEPAAWQGVLEPLVSRADARSLRSAEAAGLADALYGPESSIAMLNRFFGWLRFGSAS